MFDSRRVVSTGDISALNGFLLSSASRDELPVTPVTMVRNESEYLLEWLMYHRELGFSPAIIFDDMSSDDTLRTLEFCEGKGLCHWFRWQRSNLQERPQFAMIDTVVRAIGSKGFLKWIILSDVDEFIVIPSGTKISDVMTEFDGFDAIAVNWTVFGSGGHLHQDRSRSVVDRFRYRSEISGGSNKLVKTILRPKAFLNCLGNSHYFKLKLGSRYIYPDKTEFEKGDFFTENIACGNNEGNFAKIHLNHYVVKSKEEWIRKRVKGRVSGDGMSKIELNEEHFKIHDQNEVYDQLAFDCFLSFKDEYERIRSQCEAWLSR